MSEPPEPEPQQPPDDEDDDWRFEYELPDRPTLAKRSPYDFEGVDGGEITDMGTGDDPPRSGE